MRVDLKEFRCMSCAKLLFKANLFLARIEIRCCNCEKNILVNYNNCDLLKYLDGGLALLNNDFLTNKRNTDQALEQCMKCNCLNKCGYYIVIRKLCSF